MPMLDFDDIQHILLMRVPALTGRYEFLSFRNATGGRTWLSAIQEKVQSAAQVRASVEQEKRWVTVAFTWNGLRALGVDEASLATFPEEFKQGMVARAEMLGDTGENHPSNWVGGLASPELHAIAILFARDAEAPAQPAVGARGHGRYICSARPVLWSWRELNPRPPSGHRPRYDRSRASGSRLPPRRVEWACALRRIFLRCQRSFPSPAVFPAVIPRFCCRAAVDRPRVPFLVARYPAT